MYFMWVNCVTHELYFNKAITNIKEQAASHGPYIAYPWFEAIIIGFICSDSVIWTTQQG